MRRRRAFRRRYVVLYTVLRILLHIMLSNIKVMWAQFSLGSLPADDTPRTRCGGADVGAAIGVVFFASNITIYFQVLCATVLHNMERALRAVAAPVRHGCAPIGLEGA